jgi:nitrogen fixation protein FixH
MTDMLVSLLGGVALISVVFLLVHHFSQLNGKATALLMALLVTGIYVPLAILQWPGGDVFAIHIAIYLVTVYVLGIITSQRDARRAVGGKAFHWGPASIVVFFLLIMAADSVFIMLAQRGVDNKLAQWLLPKPETGGKVTSYFPGTVSRDFRQKEDEYNAYLERMAAQQQRDWQIKKGWEATPVAGKPAVLKLSVSDKSGAPVQGASVDGKFMRPGNVKLDIPVVLTESEPGVYRSSLSLPQAGRWKLFLLIRKDDILHELTASTTVAEARE